MGSPHCRRNLPGADDDRRYGLFGTAGNALDGLLTWRKIIARDSLGVVSGRETGMGPLHLGNVA